MTVVLNPTSSNLIRFSVYKFRNILETPIHWERDYSLKPTKTEKRKQNLKVIFSYVRMHRYKTQNLDRQICRAHKATNGI